MPQVQLRRKGYILSSRECRLQAAAFLGWYYRIGEDIEGAFKRWAESKDFLEGDLKRIWRFVVSLKDKIVVNVKGCTLLLDVGEVSYILSQNPEWVSKFPSIFKNGVRRGKRLRRLMRI